MSLTCPQCRHVVEEDGDSPRCSNCGAVIDNPALAAPLIIRYDNPNDHLPLEADLKEAELEECTADPVACAAPVDATSPAEGDAIATPKISGTAIASFASSLFIIIPLLPQLIGMVTGIITLVRRRKPGERVGLAWVGLILSSMTFLVWLLLLTRVISLPTGGLLWGVAVTPVPVSIPTVDDEAAIARVDLFATAAVRLHGAARAYHRDFRSWPDDVEKLLGRYLPPAFEIPEGLELRFIEVSSKNASEILVFSERVNWDLSGAPLDSPQRLVHRVIGEVELLDAKLVEQEIELVGE